MNLNDKRLNAYKHAAGKEQHGTSSGSPSDKYYRESFSSKNIRRPVFEKVNPLKSDIIPNEKKAKKIKDSIASFHSSDVHSNTANIHQKEDFMTSSATDQIDAAAEALKSGGLLKVPLEPNEPNGKENIYRRVAKFLLIIGVDEAAKILPYLSEEQTEKIIPEIASIRSVSPDEATAILAEFQSLMKKAKEGGGIETARTILSKAFGEKKADEMLEKTGSFLQEKPFAYLNDVDVPQICLLLKDESVAVRALVLSYLKPKTAAEIINHFPPEEKTQIIYRLAKMEAVLPEVLRRVDQAMHEKLLVQNTTKSEQLDGRNALAQILKRMSPENEQDIINNLSDDDPELGEDLRSRLFTIDDIINSEDRFIQEQLRKMSEKDIAILIAGKPEKFREKMLANVSKARSLSIVDEETIIKPVLRSDSEKITSQFFSVLRRAFENGTLFVKGRSEDAYVE